MLKASDRQVSTKSSVKPPATPLVKICTPHTWFRMYSWRSLKTELWVTGVMKYCSALAVSLFVWDCSDCAQTDLTPIPAFRLLLLRCPRPANPAKAIKALAAWLPSAAAAVTSCHASCLRLTPIWPLYNPYWLGSQYIPFIFHSIWVLCGHGSISLTSHDGAEKCFPSDPDPGTSCSRSEPELFVTFWLRLWLRAEGPGWVTGYYYASSASHDLWDIYRLGAE